MLTETEELRAEVQQLRQAVIVLGEIAQDVRLARLNIPPGQEVTARNASRLLASALVWLHIEPEVAKRTRLPAWLAHAIDQRKAMP